MDLTSLLSKRRTLLTPKDAAVAAAFILGLVLFLSILRTALFGEVPEEKRLWFEVTFLIFAALVAEMLVRYLKQPSVITLLIVGALLSPSFVGIIWGLAYGALSAIGLGALFSAAAIHTISSDGAIRVFAQLGAIFLMFEAGLHGKLEDVFNKKNLIVALLGVLVPFAGGFAYAELSGGSFAHALFVGAALTATSVGVTVAVLMELGAMQKAYAKTIIGAAVLDDVLALLVLSAIPGLETGAGGDLTLSLVYLLLTSAVFIAGGIAIGLWATGKFSERKRGDGNDEKWFLGCLAGVFFYAFAAEFIGLSAIVGAYVAGLVMSTAGLSARVLSHSKALSNLFTPMFFISLGLYVDVTTIIPAFWAITALCVIAFLTKIVGCGVGAIACGSKPNEALAIGIGMAPRGEIALIIALLGLQSGVLSSMDYSVLSAMAFITTIVPPFFLKKLAP